MPQNRNAALRGRQGGDDRQGRSHHHHDPRELAIWHRRISDWQGRLDLAAGGGNAGRSERMLGQALADLTQPCKQSVAASIPELAAKSGLGLEAVRQARNRLEAKRLIAFDSQPGRGIKTVIVLRFRERAADGW